MLDIPVSKLTLMTTLEDIHAMLTEKRQFIKLKVAWILIIVIFSGGGYWLGNQLNFIK